MSNEVRAYLSGPHRQDGAAYPFHSAATAAQCAVMEAERITRETEPPAARVVHTAPFITGHNVEVPNWVGDILADALASFIGEGR